MTETHHNKAIIKQLQCFLGDEGQLVPSYVNSDGSRMATGGIVALASPEFRGVVREIVETSPTMTNWRRRGRYALFEVCTADKDPRKRAYTYHHVIYGEVGNLNQAEQLLHDTLQQAESLGDVPQVIAGDFNFTVEESNLMGHMHEEGWFDVGRQYNHLEKTTMSRRIDMAWANRSFLACVDSYTTTKEHPTHDTVNIHTYDKAFRTVEQRRRKPKPFPQVPLTQLTEEELAEVMKGAHLKIGATKQRLQQGQDTVTKRKLVDKMVEDWSDSAQEILCRMHRIPFTKEYRTRGRVQALMEVRRAERHSVIDSPNNRIAIVRRQQVKIKRLARHLGEDVTQQQ